MRIKFLSKMVNDELNMLAPRVFAIDLIIFIATLPFYGFGTQIPCGLLLGSAAMLINITLLGYASERAVEKIVKAAKRYMLAFYLLRMFILGCAIVAGFKFGLFDPVATCLPMFYPKVIYTIRAIRKKY